MNKGKGKAVATQEPERRRAVEGGQVLLSWADLGTDDNAQRSYDQAKFEDAYRYVLNELLPAAVAKKQREREQAALNASKLGSPEASAALARILKEIDVPKAEAEKALIAANLDPNEALRSLIAPPPDLAVASRGSSVS